MGELQGNVTKALTVERAQPAIVAAANEFDSFAANKLSELSDDYAGVLPVSEYVDQLVTSMLSAEAVEQKARIAELEARVRRLESRAT